jgi:hypothetical protein
MGGLILQKNRNEWSHQDLGVRRSDSASMMRYEEKHLKTGIPHASSKFYPPKRYSPNLILFQIHKV